MIVELAATVFAALLAAASASVTGPDSARDAAVPVVELAQGGDDSGAAVVELAHDGDGSGTIADAPAARTPPTRCTYSTYQWSTEERRAVNRRTIEKDYAAVVEDERSPEDPRCTVCSEDQVEIDPASFGVDLEPFSVCWAHAANIERALRNVAESGEFRFTELTGYRPGRTRGRVVDGLRTEWSNHSFGTAIDINADRNGLYTSCDVAEVTPDSIRSCRLGMGGAWDPVGDRSRSVTRDSIVYREFVETVGWRWGGEISGGTRDLMHFSPTGE